MKKNLLLLSFAGMMLTNCGNHLYDKTPQGVIVHVEQADSLSSAPRLVRLQAMGEKIIRVSATAEKQFADPQSLIIIDQQEKVSCKVMQHGDTVTLSTAAVRANVKASTGEVWFTDAEGRLIVQE